MAAGDLVVADWTFELRTTLFGDGTNYGLELTDIPGLTGNPEVKDQDVPLEQADGSYGSPDFYVSRIIVFPIVLEGTPTQVGGWLKTWQTTLWVKSSTDIPLYGQLPGYGKFYVNGRPRPLDPDLSKITFGIITAHATFVCPDPTVTFV